MLEAGPFVTFRQQQRCIQCARLVRLGACYYNFEMTLNLDVPQIFNVYIVDG